MKIMMIKTSLIPVWSILKRKEPDKYDLERLQVWLKDNDRGALFLHKPEEEI